MTEARTVAEEQTRGSGSSGVPGRMLKHHLLQEKKIQKTGERTVRQLPLNLQVPRQEYLNLQQDPRQQNLREMGLT